MWLPKLDLLLYVCNRLVAWCPSHTFRLAFYRRLMGFKIGSRSYVFMGAFFYSSRNLTIGNNTVINQHCRLDPRGGLTIGDNVSISAEVILLTADHDPQSPHFAGRKGAISVGDHVFIGTRAMILPNVRIGRGAVVAAGAVVTKDIDDYAIVGGVPAKEISRRTSDLDYQLNYKRWFW